MLRKYFNQLQSRYKGHRPFIIPSRFSYGFAALNFLFLLIAFTYMSNVLLLFLFFVIGMGISAMHSAHFNMTPLRLKFRASAYYFKDEAQDIMIQVSNISRRPLLDLEIYLDPFRLKAQHLDRLEASANLSVGLSWTPEQRGEVKPPIVICQSFFPYGLFRCWKILEEGVALYVLPSRTKNHLPEKVNPVFRHIQLMEMADFYGHRQWTSSDSYRRIDWRAFARTGETLVQTHRAAKPPELCLSWAETQVLGDFELRLEQMSYWIFQAVQKNFSFRIEHPEIEKNRLFYGIEQAVYCLKTLENLNTTSAKEALA